MTTTLNASTAGAGGFIASGDNSGSLALQTAGTTAITVTSGQNVGVGTASPVEKVEIANGALAFSGTATFNGSGEGIYHYGANGLGLVTGGSNRMIIDSSGSVGIGVTPDANFFLTVQSTSNDAKNAVKLNQGSTGGRTQISFNNPNGQVGTIQTSGSATSYNTSSDYRLKENITPMTGALAKVALLKPVTYKWKVDGSDGEGFIAHELAEVCSHAVSGAKDAIDANGNPVYQGIDVSFLIATLTAALQDTKALIDTQAATINALTARIVALETA